MTVWQRVTLLQGNNDSMAERNSVTGKLWQRVTLLQGNNDSMAERNSVTGK